MAVLAYNEQSNLICMNEGCTALTRDSLSTDGWTQIPAASRKILQQQKQVQFELSKLDSVDSAGLAWLLNLKRDAAQAQVSITFAAVPDRLAQLAALSSVDALLLSES